MKNRKRLFGTGLILILTLIWSVTVFAAEGDTATEPAVYATIWSLLPPVVAIVFGADHQGGVQFPFYRYPGRGTVLLKFQF